MTPSSKAWGGIVVRGNLLRIGGRDFRLRPAERRVLSVLLESEGRLVPHAALVPAASPGTIDGGYGSGTRAHLIVVLSELRKLGIDVDNLKGRGYRLRPVGGDSIEHAFAEARAALSRIEKLMFSLLEGSKE